MPICSATKRDGTPCSLPAKGANGYCWAHDPQHADKRRRTASKAGRSKQNNEMRDIKLQLETLIEDVLEGEVEKGRAAVANQLINTLLRAVEIERKIRLVEDIESRIEALERRQELRYRGGNQW